VTIDPFAETEDTSESQKEVNYVHIRTQQRNGRKSLTTVQGLNAELDFKKVLKAFKKDFCCNGTVVTDKEHGEVIQVQGDQRNNIAEFLTSKGLAQKGHIKVHGF